MRKPIVLYSTLAAVVAAVFAGCAEQRDPLSADTPPPGLSERRTFGARAWTDPVMIDGYLVRFTGRDFASNQTTFRYNVSGTGVVPALSHFMVELPACAGAPVAYSPTNSTTINTNPATGIYGIEWHLSVEPDDSAGRDYSVTFAGDVPLGAVRASVQSSSVLEVGVVPGPCSGFRIAGTVFVDSDFSGTQDTQEPGITNVTVTLVDADGNTLTETTGVDGAYEFYRLAGTHTVRIDAATSALDFNEELAGSFDASTLNPRSVTVGPDSPANDFGYKPRSAKIINDLETGVLTTNGEPPRFWITVLKAAIKGTTTEFDPVTVLGFLIEIEGLVFPDPFQFTEGSELQEAVAVLTDNSRDPVDQLRVQLLAAELNHVSGKGLVGGEELQEVLISWCESLINRISATVPAAAPIVPSVSAFLPAAKGTADPEIDDANNLLTTINRSARGGGTGGQ